MTRPHEALATAQRPCGCSRAPDTQRNRAPDRQRSRAPDRQRSRALGFRGTGHRGRAGLALGLLALLLGAVGCAYRLETPRLPGNAGTLFIGVIRNRTFAGELDVRLQHRLRELLLKHPGVELGPMDQSDLILDIELTVFRPVRGRDIASTNLTSVSYQLAGLVSVYDRRQGRYYFKRSPVSVVSVIDFDTPTIETPAIRDEGIEDALQSFALQVENLLFLTF